MRDPEYDRFGPWIIEISETDPAPPLFLPYLTRGDTALLSIKIPRKIERRVANPGMNLYDYMVTLYEEDLVILQRIGDDVRPHTFFYRDVQYLCQGESLLKGSLRLAMTESVFDLPHNTVSAGIIGRLVDLIRERYCGEADHPAPIDEPDVQEADLTYFFSGCWRNRKHNIRSSRSWQHRRKKSLDLMKRAVSAGSFMASPTKVCWNRFI